MKVLKITYNPSYQLLVIICRLSPTWHGFSSNDLGPILFQPYRHLFILLATLEWRITEPRRSQTPQRHPKEFRGILYLKLWFNLVSILLYTGASFHAKTLQAYILGPAWFQRTRHFLALLGLEDFRIRLPFENITVSWSHLHLLICQSADDLYLYVICHHLWSFQVSWVCGYPLGNYWEKPILIWPMHQVHLKPVILLFYRRLLSSMSPWIGLCWASTKDVGIYTVALKLVNILLTLWRLLGSVTFPRVASLLVETTRPSIRCTKCPSGSSSAWLSRAADCKRWLCSILLRWSHAWRTHAIFRMFFIGWIQYRPPHPAW